MSWVRVREKATGKVSVKSRGVAQQLRDKYEIIEDNYLEGTVESKVETPPNVEAAGKTADVSDDGVELANVRKEYEEVIGEKPHGRLKIETLRKLIEEKKSQANAG